MNSQKFETNCFCVGGKHRSGTKKITGEITVNKETGKQNKLLVGNCMICNRKTFMIVSDNTIQAEGLGDFLKNLGKKGLNVSKKMAKNVLKNPSRALDITANIATAAASRNPKNVMESLPELIILHTTCKGLYLVKSVYILVYKWSRIVIDYIPVHN